jgi:hypothetical protein
MRNKQNRKIAFIPNNFGFDKRMQGDNALRCMMHKRKRTNKYNKGGNFSGPLQSTPPTRDLAPRSTLM